MGSVRSDDLTFRPVTVFDDLQSLTALIRSAYAPHAQRGLRYWGTHQTVEDTARRLAGGIGLVAELQGDIVATITLRCPEPESPVPLLREQHTWSFGQFSVAPRLKGQGIGKAIHDHALEVAYDHGCRTMALHTAQPATGLIAMYERWGYAHAGTCDWRPHTNYLSVLMSKALEPTR
ncbi:MAG: GNAT family N-acetyltransferase [Burkholderiales bacterium]|nr:GNAT family N-acetyltransferase [Burkholderiales bacterium]